MTPLSTLALSLSLSLAACAAPGESLLASSGRVAAPPAPRTVAILLYEGVELLDFAGPGEVFSAAHGPNGHAFRVTTVAAEAGPLRSQGFVTVTPEHTFDDCPAPDILVIPGGNVPDDALHVEFVKRCAETSELVLSVCNGAHLAADAGLLAGLEATTHHSALESLARRHPDTRVLTNRRFVDSGKVMTCAGVSAGIDGSLHVLERLLGDEAARNTARYMEYDWRPAEIRALHAEAGKLVSTPPRHAAPGKPFACPPCGQPCDDERHAAAGSCPRCGHPLERLPPEGS